MRARAKLARSFLLLAALAAVSCRPELVVRLATRAFHDGSLERNLEVQGRPADREPPTDDNWLGEQVGVRLADPEAWSRVESGGSWIKAEGFFTSADDLPPLLSFETAAARKSARTRTLLDVDDGVILKRWRYVERHGDPFDAADSAAALDALADLVVEALRQEVQQHLGSDVDTAKAERFVRREVRALVNALLTVNRSAAGWQQSGERAERWSGVLSQHDVTPLEADPDDYWDDQLPTLLEWSREGVAAALSTPDATIRGEELDFWPAGDGWEQQATAIVERVWGSEDELWERIEPHVGALAGYYGSEGRPWFQGGKGAPRFRFEVRATLPGTLLATNGTPDGESVVWLFRGRDLTLGEVALRATAVELQTEALVSLGARRDFDRLGLVQLADLVFKRDPQGLLTEVLKTAVVQGSLDPLRDDSLIPDEMILVAAELAELLEPDGP